MTDWRALTDGGCIAGSISVNRGGSATFTAPSGVRVVRLLHYYTSSGYYYLSCTPGTTYNLYFNSSGQEMYVNNSKGTWDTKDGTLTWSNDINAQSVSGDLGSPVVPECDCDCDCDCSASCFIAGTQVLCYNDNSGIQYYKNIEELVPNDKVIGANGTISNVLGLYKATLGDQRSILTFEDQSLYFSDEHPFWVRLDGKEGFGVHNYNAYYLEKIAKNKDGYTIFDHEICETLGKPLEHLVGYQGEQQIIYGNNVEYATTKGFAKHRAKIDRRYDSSTPIYTPILDGSHTMFVNNYLVSTFMLNDWDWKQISCDKTEKALKGLRLSS